MRRRHNQYRLRYAMVQAGRVPARGLLVCDRDGYAQILQSKCHISAHPQTTKTWLPRKVTIENMRDLNSGFPNLYLLLSWTLYSAQQNPRRAFGCAVAKRHNVQNRNFWRRSWLTRLFLKLVASRCAIPEAKMIGEEACGSA
jgi:hypothetical protein